jgi:disulfide bond formation protein DsbB
MEPISIVLIIFGIFSLCQPFTFFLYHYGFAFLGVGTGLYILFSHIPPLEEFLREEG